MKKLLAITLSVVMVLSLMTGLTLNVSAADIVPTATLIDNTEGQILGWKLTNNTNANYYQAWHDNTNHHFVFEGFDNVATIQTKRFEPANDPWKTLYNTNKQGTWATLKVNNSCEVYAIGGEARNETGKWLIDGGFELVGAVTSDFANNPPTLNVYKKTINIYAGETASIELGATNPVWNNQMYSYIVKWIDNPELTSRTAILKDYNNLGWVLTNNVDISESYSLYYDNGTKIEGFFDSKDAVTIQTGRYETANGGKNYDFFKGKATDYVAGIEVNNSCDLYVITPLEVRDACGKWLSNDGYTLVDTVKNTDNNPQDRFIYKKSFNMVDNEKMTIQVGAMSSSIINQQCSFVIVWTENLETALPKASLNDSNNLGWVLINDADISESYKIYHNSGVTLNNIFNAKNAAIIQTGRYETANGGANYEFFKGKAADYVADIVVNHSCDFYVVSPLDARDNCGKWIINDGYTLESTVSSSEGKSIYLYKRTVKLKDNETYTIKVGGLNSIIMNQQVAFAVVWTDNRIDATLTFANKSGLNWGVVNNTTITSNSSSKAYTGENKYYTDVTGYDFTDVSYLQSYSRYEPAAEPYKTIHMGLNYQTLDTMTVDNSCEVYIVLNYQPGDNYLQWIENYGYQLQDKKIAISGVEGFVYKRAYYLKDGETLEIPLGAANSKLVNQGYNVIVKWIENPEVCHPRVTFTTLGDTAQYYTITENAHVGERISVSSSRKIGNFNNSGLEGAYILKPYAGDVYDPDFNYKDRPEDDSLVNDTDFYTVTLDKTATVYVALSGKYIPGTYMRWLADWQLATDAEGNEATINIVNTAGTYTKDWNLYKKTFIVPEGETRTITLGNAVLYANEMYTTFFKFTDGPAYTVDVSVAGEGAKVHPSTSTDVLAGEKLPFVIGTENNYFVKSVKFNGTEIYSDSDSEINWITPEITANATVEIVVEFDENYPLPANISSVASAFSAKGTEDLVVDYKVYPLNVIGFATAKANIGPHKRGEFGMLVVTEKPESAEALTVESEAVLKALADGANSEGQFGIRLYGDSVTSGQKVWMRAYAYYGDTVLYGSELIEAEF